MTQRRPRMVDPGYLAFLRKKPCCLCGRRSRVEAAHIRIGLFAMGMKPDDKDAVPLCAPHHRTGEGGVIAQHSMSEEVFWYLNSVNPFEIAARLYKEYGGDGGKPYRKPKRDPIKQAMADAIKARAKMHRRLQRAKRKQKIPSRPFPKTQRKLQSRGFRK